MKTILQVLIDEIHYPIGTGHAENRVLKRGLNGDDECTTEVMNGNAFMGALADCLVFLLSAPNFSEADKQLSMTDKTNMLKQANMIYRSIGEEEKILESSPSVHVGDCLIP